MARKKSLGSNPLGAKGGDHVLREVLQGRRARPSREERPRLTALVLSGRGGEAAFEVGVLSGLAKADAFDADVVTGVSLGALNAAVIAAQDGRLAKAAARLEAIWIEQLAGDAWTGRNGLYRSRGDPRSFLDPRKLPGAIADMLEDSSYWLKDAWERGARMARSSDDLAVRMLWLADVSSMLSLEPLAELVEKQVDLGAVRGSKRRMRVATAEWVSGRVEISDGAALQGKAGYDLLVAAAARPGIFPSVEIHGRPQVDAAPFLASELGPALEAGATELHVPVFAASRAPDDRPTSTFDALDRALAELQLARLERELLSLRASGEPAPAVHLYRGRLGPARSHGFLDVGRDRIRRLLEHGRQTFASHDCSAAGCLADGARARREG
jgi:predicted acylesterase/phospholipase RssA